VPARPPPYRASAISNAKLQEVRVQNPMGKRLHEKSNARYKLARRGGCACLRTSRLPSQAYVL